MPFKINLASLISGRNLPFLLCFTLYLMAISIYIYIYIYILEVGKIETQTSYIYIYICRGDLTEEFFALRVWGAYIWRGLYMEGLIFGFLRYFEL